MASPVENDGTRQPSAPPVSTSPPRMRLPTAAAAESQTLGQPPATPVHADPARIVRQGLQCVVDRLRCDAADCTSAGDPRMSIEPTRPSQRRSDPSPPYGAAAAPPASLYTNRQRPRSRITTAYQSHAAQQPRVFMGRPSHIYHYLTTIWINDRGDTVHLHDRASEGQEYDSSTGIVHHPDQLPIAPGHPQGAPFDYQRAIATSSTSRAAREETPPRAAAPRYRTPDPELASQQNVSGAGELTLDFRTAAVPGHRGGRAERTVRGGRGGRGVVVGSRVEKATRRGA